ncbi:MAG: 30S ribosome-binding factor RbfA [Chloroflexi bacterium]|nr:30S ribosome-binding factor RbfA [Chloroflexota bacterium]
MGHRVERLNSLFRQEISELLRRQVKDPRLGNFVTVTEVSISSDLKHARVFVSSLSGQKDKEEILGALTSASGFIRRELANHVKLRSIPELTFQWDESLERGDRILRLLDQLSAEKKDVS